MLAQGMKQMENLTYGEKVVVDFTALPEVSQQALAQRGLTHVLGNEVASKVHSWAGQEGQANSDDKATVKAWKDANEAKLVDKTAEFVNDALKALVDGTLGTRAGGPRLTPIDTIKRQIARGQIEAIFKGHKISVPKGDKKVKTPDGEFTMDELIARRLVMVTKDGKDIGAAISAEAEKELARRKREMDKQIAAVAGTELGDLL